MEILKGKLGSERVFQWLYRYGTLLAILLLAAFFGVATQGRFIEAGNIVNMLRAMAITTVIACGVTLSLAVGGFDLSVGSVASLSMTVTMGAFVWLDQGLLVACGAGLLAALLVGLVNSFLIVKLGIPDMLTTLASLFIVGGLATTLSKGKIISQQMTLEDGSTSVGLVDPLFRLFGKAPLIIVIMVVLVLAVHGFLTYTRYGRLLYAVGANPRASRLSGVNVGGYRALAYSLSALLAGIGGMLLAARVGQANPGAGGGYLMEAVAAAYIGFSLGGAGKPNVVGTFFGALLMAALSNGLIMLSVPYYAMDIIKGAVLILALALTYSRQSRD